MILCKAEESEPYDSEYCNLMFNGAGKRENAVDVGLSMMCYTQGKAERACLGDFQLRGLMGK